MAADIQFDAQKFEKLTKEADRLRELANQKLQKITQITQALQDAGDTITKAIYKIASDFAPKFQSLIESVKKLIDAFMEVKKKITDFAKDAIGGLINAAGQFISGTSAKIDFD